MSTVDYAEIFEKAEVGIALNNPEKGTVGLVNARYAELLGYAREELREMQIEEISAEDPAFDQEAAMEKIHQTLEGDPQRFDWLFERKDGSQFWAEVVLKRTMIGEQDRLLAFVRDISPRKQYEKELERQNERLDEFARNVSHELRHPLNLAFGRLELARDECESEHLDALEQAHQRLQDRIEDVLSLAQSGKTVLDTESVDLAELVQACWGTIETDSATLEIEDGTSLLADVPRLRQLLENLLRNAVSHGGNGVTVTVGTHDTGFFIEDDGPGIPEEARDNIFEANYTTSDIGTGYGLSIVEQIADAHGWEIDVTPGKNGGARFEVTNIDLV